MEQAVDVREPLALTASPRQIASIIQEFLGLVVQSRAGKSDVWRKDTARLRAVRIRSESRRPNRPTRLGSIALATGRVERRLAAILAADVAGYSRLMETDEEGTLSPAGCRLAARKTGAAFRRRS
jgi:class 3 adenylate cyclase